MKPTKEEIKARYAEFNTMYFKGVLPKCKFSATYIDSMGRYTFDKKAQLGHIWVRKAQMSEERFKEILIHEMIHHYIQTVEGKRGGLFGHNWRFRRQCRRLIKEFGIRIGVWNTLGLRDCFCVIDPQ